MNISLREIIEAIAPAAATAPQQHPLIGRKVIVISTNGFVYAGILEQYGNLLCLREASNIRYWSKRDGGLPELAQNGFCDQDKIDKINGLVVLHSVVAIMESNHE